MNKKTLVSLVKKEAKNLKKNATKSERNLLEFNSLLPNKSYGCIYGRMTGSCWSPRASELIKNCAERVYDNTGYDLTQGRLSGKPEFSDDGDRDFFSPIECFIYFKQNATNGNNKNLIDYLKGERKTLRFKKF